MKGSEFIAQVTRVHMPDVEQVRANCHAAVQNFGKKRSAYRYAAAAAFAVLAVTVAVGLQNQGVKVNYIDSPPNVSIEHDLVFLTEEELFAPYWRGLEVVAFEGEIVKTDNIVIDFGSNNKTYRAIAHILVNDVYRGDVEVGATVTVLLPGPVGVSGMWVEDTDASSLMTAGTRGIFMPACYDENSYWEESGETLYLTDLAEYGMLDGARWAFIETADGAAFARWAYEGAAGAESFGEIRDYVKEMLEKFS